jgi:hypothetical protein
MMKSAASKPIFTGGKNCSLAAIQFVVAFGHSLSQKNKELFDDVEAGIPTNPNTLDEEITGIRASIAALRTLFIANNSLTPAQDKNFTQAKSFLEISLATQVTLAAKAKEYTEAGDAALVFLRAQGGETIHTALAAAATESPDRMLQARQVVTFIKTTYFGVPADVRLQLDAQMGAIPEADNTAEAVEVFTSMEAVLCRMQIHVDACPEAVANGELRPVPTPLEIITMYTTKLRLDITVPDYRLISNLLTWIETKPPGVGPAAQHTLATVKAKVIETGQRGDKVVSNAQGKQSAASGHARDHMAASAHQHHEHLSIAQSTVEAAGGTIYYPANVAGAAYAGAPSGHEYRGREMSHGPYPWGGGRGALPRSSNDHGKPSINPNGGLSTPPPRGECRLWHTNGYCSFGQGCSYIHTGEDNEHAAKKPRGGDSKEDS